MRNVRPLAFGGLTACLLLTCAFAIVGLAAETQPASDPAAADPDNVPRVVGGGSVLGGAASIAVIPYALPPIPADTESQAAPRTAWGAPDLSGIYGHRARLFGNPAPLGGVGPGIATAPSPLTLHPEVRTDGLGSRGDHHTPLLRPWAAELVKQYGDSEAAARPYAERCWVNNGLLIIWARDPGGRGGMRVVQTPQRIYMFFGQDVVRVIHLDAEHPADLKPSVNGHSTGRWEGDTLVVDTIGFDGTSDADRYGTPTTEELHVVERMSLRHGNQVLEVSFWVDDPLVFTQPWTSVTTFARQEKTGFEYVCREVQMFPPPY